MIPIGIDLGNKGDGRAIWIANLGFILLIVRFGIWLFTNKKESNYFRCKMCGKKYYKDFQTEKDICKNCSL